MSNPFELERKKIVTCIPTNYLYKFDNARSTSDLEVPVEPRRPSRPTSLCGIQPMNITPRQSSPSEQDTEDLVSLPPNGTLDLASPSNGTIHVSFDDQFEKYCLRKEKRWEWNRRMDSVTTIGTRAVRDINRINTFNQNSISYLRTTYHNFF